MNHEVCHLALVDSHFVQKTLHTFRARLDRELEHLPAFHLHRDVLFLFCDVRRVNKCPELPDLILGWLCMQFCAFDVVPFGQHYGSGPVSEQDTCSSVFPTGHPGRLLDARHDGVPDLSGFVVCLRHIQGIDESRTSAVDVEHRAFESEFFTDDAAHSRGDIFGDDIGDYEEVDVFGFQSGHLKSLSYGFGSEILQILVCDHVSCLDSGARVDPLVAGVQKSRKHIIGHDLFWKRASCTDDFHKFTVIKVFSMQKYEYAGAAQKLSGEDTQSAVFVVRMWRFR